MMIKDTRFTYFLFVLAIISIPFGNLEFAPSKGWATIAPILFFIYYVVSLAGAPRINKSEKNVHSCVALLVLYSLVIYMIYPPTPSLALGSIITLVLGAMFYSSLIREIDSSCYELEVVRYKKILNFVTIGYGASLVYGLIFIISYKYGITPIINIFSSIEARYYGGRYSFSFTEPSFASMQIFGVYGAFILIGRKYYPEAVSRRLWVFYIIYMLAAVICISSIRLKIDTIIVALLFYIGWMMERNKFGKVSLFIGVAGTLFFVRSHVLHMLIGLSGPRLQEIFSAALYSPEYLVYSDNSLSVRYFLSNALVMGAWSNPLQSLFGHGIGNASYLFFSGYDMAMAAYGSSYLDPIFRLADKPLANYYNLPLRVYAEFGILGLFIAIKYWWRKSNASLVLPAIYLSLQFDSYAFFMIWIVLFANHVYDRRKLGDGPYFSYKG